MTTHKIGWKQRIREQPVIVARIVGSAVSLLVVQFALPISDEMKELIQIVILAILLGPGALETIYQYNKVSPTAKIERLKKG